MSDRQIKQIEDLRRLLRAAYGHDVYEFGCPECGRGAPHKKRCRLALEIFPRGGDPYGGLPRGEL